MSVVKKLQIQGIRSFSPNDAKAQMIEFYTPLTLILGMNGSGKTTIIEALKYAITNTFPPNCNKGASFVNDPKLGNGVETMGTVKLELLDSKGNTVLTTRRVKVTVKDKFGNLTKKELEATFRIMDSKGQPKKELQNKCLDVKIEMSRLMGVSEAILNNVLLCHQEDSCWPLDEGKKVKEKFDAIFNTTMYIKCLDMLTKQDKELTQRAKVEAEKLNYAKDNLKMMKKKEKELKSKEIELQAIEDNVRSQRDELKEMEKKLKALETLEREYAEVHNQISGMKGKLEEIRKQVGNLEANIKEKVDKDITGLQRDIQRSDAEYESKQRHQGQLEAEVRGKDAELTRVVEQQRQFFVAEGKFQQEDDANKARIRALKSLVADVVKLAARLKESSQDAAFCDSMDACLETCDVDSDNVQVGPMVRTLGSAIRQREAEINKTKALYEQEEKEHQKKLDELRSKKASIEKEIEMKSAHIKENIQTANDLRRRLREIEGSNVTLKQLEEEENGFDKEITSIESSGILMKCDAARKQLDVEIRDLEGHIAESLNQVKLLTADKAILDNISIFNKQKMQKQSDCKVILRNIETDLANLLDDIPEDGLADAFDQKHTSLVQELSERKSSYRDLEKKLSEKTAELKQLKTELSKKERQRNSWKEQIEEVVQGHDFTQEYERVKEELEEKTKERLYAETAAYHYKQLTRKLRNLKRCPVCQKGVESQRELDDVVKSLEQEALRSQEALPIDNDQIERLKEREKRLMALKPIWDTFQSTESEIPELQMKRSNVEDSIQEVRESVDDLNMILVELEDNKSKLDKYRRDVVLFENFQKEIKEYESRIASLEASRNLDAKALAASTSLAAAETTLQEHENSLKTKQLEKNNSINMLNNKRDEINKLTRQKNTVREKILKITSELQSLDALEAQKRNLEESNKQLQDDISSLKQEVPRAKTQINDAEKEKAICTDKKEKCLQVLRQDKDSLEKHKGKLLEIEQQINDFERTKAKFVETQKQSQDCKLRVQDLEKQKTAISSKLEAVKNDIANHESLQRNLQDNLTYRMKLVEKKKLELDLQEKEKLIESTQTRGTSTEKRELSTKHHQKTAQVNREIGKQQEIVTSVTELRKELGERPLVNAKDDFVERLVKKTIYEKAQKDVRRYKTALDQAIMAFHNKRMQTINDHLAEYWRRVYQGNDIDSIKILTEAASAKGAEDGKHKVAIETKGRKNYSYRVVMVRHGRELDMRGRCSAGQRVLASIIIRIALADSFSTRCGLITLDEPTTNLDQKNINALAEALKGLANRMTQQRNFQLVVITHDQEFTERLSEIDAVETYWNVSRDNMGFSQVKAIHKR